MNYDEEKSIFLNCIFFLYFIQNSLQSRKVKTHTSSSPQYFSESNASEDTPDSRKSKSAIEKDKPNIIFILIDDAGYDDFGFTGCKDWETPNIDNLAKSGVVFNNAYVSASVCGPSRAGLITGRYQQTFGLEENLTGKSIEPVAKEDYGVPVDVPMIGTLLKDKGYTTAAFGKWHLGEHNNFHPNNRGFNYFYGFLGGSRSYWPSKKELKAGPTTLIENYELKRTPEYLTDQLGKKCAGYIANNKENPFFIYLSFNAVHSPMHAKEEDKNELDTIKSDRRKTLGAMTLSLDRSIGYVVDELKKNNLYKNTMIIFTNDNGAATYLETNNDGMRGRKGTVWEGGIRIPFTLSWPERIEGGQKSASLISTLDIVSTLCKLTGYSNEDLTNLNLDGENLFDILKGEERRNPLFWKRGNMSAIRLGPWKLISLNNEPAFLMNVKNDPLEKINYLTIKTEIVKDLNSKLESWKKNNPKPIWVKTSHDVYADQLLKYWDN